MNSRQREWLFEGALRRQAERNLAAVEARQRAHEERVRAAELEVIRLEADEQQASDQLTALRDRLDLPARARAPGRGPLSGVAAAAPGGHGSHRPRSRRRFPVLSTTAPIAPLLAFLALALGGCSPGGTPEPDDGSGAPAPGRAASTAQRGSILLVLTNHGALGQTGNPTGFYLSEAAHPWEVFTKAGYEVVLASPEGGRAPVDPKSLDLEDETNAAFHERFVQDGAVPGTVALADVEPVDHAAVFFAGGHGTMWDFPDHPEVDRVGEAVHARGGVVGAVCHGPAALVGMKGVDGEPLVKGLAVTGFTNSEEEAVELTEAMPFLLETRLRELGARFDGAADFAANVAVGERVVTGQNPASAEAAARAVVEQLRTRRPAS